ncbi:MAG: BrnT family toxin [Deltaproteobacteria bacterium]|nr:BrnT family toxin [Deltaproteobacteria bacterium]
MKFQWDRDKAKKNLKKHGIDFADAVIVFEDDMALTMEDPDAEGEPRFVTVGNDALGRVVTVVYTWREEDIRLISARTATKRERQAYEEET